MFDYLNSQIILVLSYVKMNFRLQAKTSTFYARAIMVQNERTKRSRTLQLSRD